MFNTVRPVARVACLIGMLAMVGCESPTSPDDDDDDSNDTIVDLVTHPDPIIAEAATGRTYRVVRGNNQPDDILAYDWRAVFTLDITVNSNALDDDFDIVFPVTLKSTSVGVRQATGGIATPPVSGDAEHSEYAILATTGNTISAANGTISVTFEVYYDLPNLRKEALIDLTLSFTDSDSDGAKSFSRMASLQVAP